MYEKYCRLRDERNVRDIDISRETGIPQSTFSDWKKGKSSPKIEKLSKLADYFKVPLSYFSEASEQKKYELNIQVFSDTEIKKLNAKFNKLDDADKQTILLMMDSMLKNDKYKKHSASEVG